MEQFTSVKLKFADVWKGDVDTRLALEKLHADSIQFRVVASMFVQYYIVLRCNNSGVYEKFQRRVRDGRTGEAIDLTFMHFNDSMMDRIMRPFSGAGGKLEFLDSALEYIEINKALREFAVQVLEQTDFEPLDNQLLSLSYREIAKEFYKNLKTYVKVNFSLHLANFFISHLKVDCQFDNFYMKSLVKKLVDQAKRDFHRRVVSLELLAKVYVGDLYNNHGHLKRITDETFDEFLVVMFCLQKHLEELKDSSMVPIKILQLIPQYKVKAAHIFLTNQMFSNQQQHPLLAQEEWIQSCFNTDSFKQQFAGSITTDLYSVSFLVYSHGVAAPLAAEAQVALEYFLDEQDAEDADEDDVDADELEIEEEDVEQDLQEDVPHVDWSFLNDESFSNLRRDTNTVFGAIDPGINKAIQMAFFSHMNGNISPLDEFCLLNSRRQLKFATESDLGQHQATRRTPPLISLPIGVTNKTSDLVSLQQYCVTYLQLSSVAIVRVLSGDARKIQFEYWEHRRAVLQNAVKRLLGLEQLDETRRYQFIIFFGRGGEFGFAGFGRKRVPPLVQLRYILNKYATVVVTPEPWTSSRCCACHSFGTRYRRPQDKFVCMRDPNHQMNGDSNAAVNILYIGLYMMMHGGTFPQHFINQ
ncbi:hypothetical protein MP228_012542 [Amoeboaphelidium protococcarum]|nr:hypothetical protein MP228_012542 [Amoeboaphelidium protococcarum]